MRVKRKYAVIQNYETELFKFGLEGTVIDINVKTDTHSFLIEKIDRIALGRLFLNYVIYYKVKMDHGQIIELLDEEVEII